MMSADSAVTRSASGSQGPARLYYDRETYTHQEKLKLVGREEKRFRAASPSVSVAMAALASPERSSRSATQRRVAWRCEMCSFAWLHTVDALHVDCPHCLSRQPRRAELTEEERA